MFEHERLSTCWHFREMYPSTIACKKKKKLTDHICRLVQVHWHSLLLIPVSADIQSCSWDRWDLLGSESSDIETEGPCGCLHACQFSWLHRLVDRSFTSRYNVPTRRYDNFFYFKGTTSPAPAADYNWGLDFGCSFLFFTDGAPRQKEEKRKTTEDLWMQWRRTCKDLVWQRRMIGIELDGGRWSVGKTPKGSDWKKKNLS